MLSDIIDMKTLFSTLYLVLVLDLILAKYETEQKSTGSKIPQETFLAVASMGNGGNQEAEYFIIVTDRSAVLSVKEKSGTNDLHTLKTIDSKPLPAGFHPISADCTLLFLPSNDSVFFCADNFENTTACLFIPISGRPYARIDSFVPVNSDYAGSRKIWNSYRVVSEDGRAVITAFLNATAVYEPSWIVRQKFDTKSALSTSGVAFDHRLARLKDPYSSSDNVFAFRHHGFAYVLRYAYRYKHIEGSDFEWVWQLTRVCLNDETKDLRSRISIPLACDFPTQKGEQRVGWRPTAGYVDEKDAKFYVYIQPNVSVNDPDVLRAMSHRICSFDMKTVVNEFERTFNRCYNEFSPLVAAHGALRETKTCSSYRNPYPSGYECKYDICNSAECIVGAFYHLEIYEALYGIPVSAISFRYQSSDNVDSAAYKPAAMYVTRSTEEPVTVQAFIQDIKGNVFMVFLNGTTSAVPAFQPPAWTSDSAYETKRMLELPAGDGVQLVGGPDLAVDVLQAGCRLYSECRHLMERSTGEQARQLWGCGWCETDDAKYGSTEEQCRRANGYFHKDACPPAANCFQPRTWLSDDNVSLEISGHFPKSFEYKVFACGAKCQNVKITSEKFENSLTCTASPPYHIAEHTRPTCGVEILVIDAGNQSNILYKLEPACSNDTLIPATVTGTGTGKTDMTAWLAFIAVSSAIIMAAVISALLKFYRRREKRRQRNYDSLALPMTVTVELSRNNEYVLRNVHRENQLVAPNSDRVYEDLSHLVPRELLINFERIDLGALIGQGHFGQVFKGRYSPAGDNEITVPVAVKTLISETNARQFLREGIIMETFDHPHVLSLIGISFNNNNLPMIVTPYMAKGDLLSFIRNPENRPSVGQLLRFGVEIAEGMQYLHKLKFIHRDLAARNCMLDDNLHIKIADFGLSRDVYESECYLSSQNVDLPIRWMPPESIERREYTNKSDVWSYGVVLWELTTRGEVPYSGMSGFAVLSYLKTGRRLSKPQHCPEPVHDVMRLCWQIAPADRPDFLTLSAKVPEAIREIEASAGATLTRVNEPNYYNVSPIEQEQIVTTA